MLLNVDVLEAEKMGNHKHLSEFNKGQIVMARQLSQICKTVGCSQFGVASIYQKGHGLVKAHGCGAKAGSCGPIQQTR